MAGSDSSAVEELEEKAQHSETKTKRHRKLLKCSTLLFEVTYEEICLSHVILELTVICEQCCM